MGQKQTNIRKIDINHPKFQNSKVFTKGKVDFIQTSISLKQDQYIAWKKKLKTTQINKQFLLLPQNHEFSSASICSQSGLAILQYPNYSLPLTDQIQDRTHKKQFFQQTQLWYLLYALASAKQSMRPKEVKVGDIRPQNIFINQNGHLKVINSYSWPNAKTNFSKTLNGQVTYLAPQQLIHLKDGRIQNADNSIAQTFSIGLTVLSAAVLQDNCDIYDLESGVMKQNLLKSKLDKFKLQSQYSDIFKSTISNLCKIDPQKRMVPEQLWKILRKHQNKIKNKENFVIEDAPQKLHNQFKQLQQYLPLLQKTFALANINLPLLPKDNSIPQHQIINQPDKHETHFNRHTITNSLPKRQVHESVSNVNFRNTVPSESPVKKI